MRNPLAVAVSVLLAACSEPALEGPGGELQDAQGAAMSALDTADRSCGIALRSLERVLRNGRFETSCEAGSCWVVWAGVVDVDATVAASGGQANVLYRNRNDSQWSAATATRIENDDGDAPAGFVRYGFRLERRTMQDGLSSTGIARTKIEVAPYWQTASGDKLFDKQRGQGDFDNYQLNAENQFSVVADPAVCPGGNRVDATVDFLSTWQTEQHGALTAGGTVTINYALERLTDCRATHNGYPAWSLEANIRFLPSGIVRTGPVKTHDSTGGVPHGDAVPIPFVAAVPRGTTRAEVWFRASKSVYSQCEAYDSNNGANYAFEVQPTAPNPVGWSGDVGSSFARDCERRAGVADPATLDSYVQQRACAFIEVDAWVPGLTDSATGGATAPTSILARAVTALDGAQRPATWLTFSGRAGNNYRYRFTVPKSDLYYGPKWATFSYTLQTSTDGRTWVSEPTRAIRRDVSFCNPAWVSCD